MGFSDDDDKVVWADWAENEIQRRDRRIQSLTLRLSEASAVLRSMVENNRIALAEYPEIRLIVARLAEEEGI
jgi:hypothetical protein